MSNKEITKKDIEQIALYLLEKNKSYNGLLSEQFIKSLEDNSNMESNKENDDKEETMKDRIYIAEKKFETFIENKKINDKKPKKNKNSKIINKKASDCDLKFCTTINNSLTDIYYCCKKNGVRNSELVEEENKKNNENYSSLKLKDNKDNKNNNSLEIFNDNLYSIEFISNNEFLKNEEINLDECNKILRIYKYILNNFSLNNDKDKNNTLDIMLILSNEFIKFIFNGKIYIILHFFNYSIDIIKFIFYQIFIFLNVLYFDEIKNISESLEMTFKTLFLYSSQNFNIILDIISNPTSYVNQEDKITKKFFGRNKIIFSILKTLSPKKKGLLISNHNEKNLSIYKTIYNIIEEVENEAKLNRTMEIRNNIYNKLDKYIISLKTNQLLIDKINFIDQKFNTINIEELLNEVKLEEEINSQNNNTKKYLTLPKPIRESEEFNYKFTIFIELDETLVHYYEEGENYFVKVRQNTDEFLKKMHEFCELIIVSTSSKEYTDIILENLNKEKKLIDRTIYKEICDNDNIEIDFTKINRDLKKCIFICHDLNDFFKAPENNVIELKEFNGEEEDKEIIFLQEEFMKFNIDTDEIDDIKNIIKDIKFIMEQKRNVGE